MWPALMTVSVCLCIMGVVACLRWEVSMAQFTSTNRHDFRWPTSDCLVPRAEATNGKCVPPPPPNGLDRPWCGRDKPHTADPSPVDPSWECHDIKPAQGDSTKPWCERGLLVEQLHSRTATAPPKVKSAPAGCEAQRLARPWFEEDASPRPLAAKMGAAPQQDTSRYDQPNQYLRKLCDKFPEPVSVVTAKPRDELMRRVYADRYRTTYQTDYCRNSDDLARVIGECDTHDVNNNKYKTAGWDNQGCTVTSADSYDVEGLGPQYESCKCGCGCKVVRKMQLQSGGDGGEPRLRPLACRPAAVSKNVHFSCCNIKRKGGQTAEQVGPPEKIPPWISEYNASIGKTGQLIMEEKLHYPKKTKKH